MIKANVAVIEADLDIHPQSLLGIFDAMVPHDIKVIEFKENSDGTYKIILDVEKTGLKGGKWKATFDRKYKSPMQSELTLKLEPYEE